MLAREWLEKGIDEYEAEDYVRAWSSFQLALKAGFPDVIHDVHSRKSTCMMYIDMTKEKLIESGIVKQRGRTLIFDISKGQHDRTKEDMEQNGNG